MKWRRRGHHKRKSQIAERNWAAPEHRVTLSTPTPLALNPFPAPIDPSSGLSNDQIVAHITEHNVIPPQGMWNREYRDGGAQSPTVLVAINGLIRRHPMLPQVSAVLAFDPVTALREYGPAYLAAYLLDHS